MLLASDQLLAVGVVIGVVGLASGWRGWPGYLIFAGVCRWVLWPMALPFVQAIIDSVPSWLWIIASPVVALLVILAVIRILQKLMGLIYGQHVGAVVTSELLIGLFAALGAGLRRLVRGPKGQKPKNQELGKRRRRGQA